MAVGRFAPSPSGRMHLGNLFSCLLIWLSCRKQGGRLILRMEDLDSARCPRQYGVQLAEDLRWLGLDWDDGPVYQTDRLPLYEKALRRLSEQGLLYPCFCTRAELHAASAPHRDDGQVIYAGACRNLTEQEVSARQAVRRPAVRLRVPDEAITFQDGLQGTYRENLARDCGDFLLRRSDGVFAYQLAVVVDDGEMGVTEVTRGVDLLSSTPRQLYLYRLLGYMPPRFYHIPLLLAPDGRRLSKRNADTGLDVLRKRYTAEEILGKLACWAGFHPSGMPATARELLAEFSWDKVTKENIVIAGNISDK